MLLRIFLILTILAGIGTIAVTQFQVRPHIQGIIDERERQTQRAVRAEKNYSDTRKELGNTQEELRTTEKNLEETKTQLDGTRNQLNTERDRANNLQKDLDDTNAKWRAARQELSAWDALGIPVDQVKDLIAAEKKLRVEIEALTAEKGIITEQLNRALEKIDIYEGLKDENFEVPLPQGIRGKVLVVDPKWKFVVLNLGRNDKVEENGVLMVSRRGKLIAKVMIKRVQENRCIANVMPGWSFDDIMEGDAVLN